MKNSHRQKLWQKYRVETGRKKKASEQTHYLEQLVSQVGLNQPVVQSDVEQLVLRPLGQTEYLLKLWASIISLLHNV